MKTDQRIGQYNIIKTLGEGSFGKVKLAVHRGTGQQVALKIISRKKLISRDMAGRVEREIEYLQLLRHPHIIKLFTVIKTPTEIIMVLEYAGGELFDYIVQHGRMEEDEARRFFQQMLCAVEYCHRHKIVHRDLKPENLLLDEKLNVKIADFGLSNIMTDGNFLKTSCGSPNYAAPEVIGGKLYAGPEVDVWSCGVILYVLLVGRLPFDDEHIPSLFAKIARGTYAVPKWMSPGAAHLIEKMLKVNPVQRATIPEIRQDPWFMKNLPEYLQPPIEPFYNTGIDPDKAIKPSDIAPNAPARVQEKLHNEVTEKISKTMGYGKQDVQEALEAEEPSAIKDAYMIVRENKLMQVNQAPDTGSSPLASSARSITSTSTSASPRPYVSKVSVMPSSLPAFHKDFMERERNGFEEPPVQPIAPEPSSQPRSEDERQESIRRLKPHTRNPVRLDESNKRPQGLTPVNPPKKPKATRWQFGIRSRNAPWEALGVIYRSLSKLGCSWVPDEDYDKEHGGEDEQQQQARHRRSASSRTNNDLTKIYKLPADPWHIQVRWETERLRMGAHLPEDHPNHLSNTVKSGDDEYQVIAMRLDIQIYEMAEAGSYLVDFKCDGYETPDGKILEEKQVTSPFPFLDLAARLIMQLADAE
ncbi:protein kinase SNF1 [Cryphonectria parasitica EP155]|uniref:non-specific serine/threonine protein kinase n=1 Tax=Cryphonectria parasitica (strain ATCC 38755 / EP155) TaxID=660469 RepID=A0A9P4XT09_CRYP1|nr:protein kinase SNF1 [Cryphonectria parasitica EP155]KAF3760764.1 protein kinase SNF1 [Cryphonectria parasitica EP155]